MRRALARAGVLLAACLALVSPLQGQLPSPPVTASGPLQVGGYAALTLTHAERPEKSERPEVSELVAALMAWGQLSSRASYLVELDMAKRTTETWTGRESDRWLLPVRAYLEYTASDLVRLRVGRFLTPIGQWNEQHVEPLTWTPTRPLATYRPFAKSVTGVLLAGEGSLGGHDAGYALFWAPFGDVRGGWAEPEESRFVHAAGARVAAQLARELTFGVSGAAVVRSQPWEEEREYRAVQGPEIPFRVEDGEDAEHHEREEDRGTRSLLGADLRWTRAGFEVAAEATWLPGAAGSPAEGGAFAQAAVRVVGPVWAVGRAEAYRLPDAAEERVAFAGLTLRALPRAVVKLGWQFSRRPSARIPDGWFLSFSSLF